MTKTKVKYKTLHQTDRDEFRTQHTWNSSRLSEKARGGA